MSKNQTQSGFAVLEAVIILVVVAAIGTAGYFVFAKNKNKQTEPIASSNAAQVAEKSSAKIKHLGINLDAYDPATNKAGDLLFTKQKFSSNIQMIFMPYGYVISGENTSTGQSKGNPQPTFIAPLGTKVHAIVDGTVFEVPTLWSKDYSVQIQPEGSDLIFEMEHVINVKVKKGDKVKAGDVVAEVSDFDARNYAGQGLVEFGVLKGGNPPSHLCLFDYLDDSIKDDTFAKITALMKSWEDYRSDSTIYDESKVVVPGCYSRDAIEG